MNNTEPTLRQYISFWKNWIETKQVTLGHAASDFIPSYSSWHSSLRRINASPLQDHMPWMTFSTIRFLQRNLTKNMRVFEYGSGGSSVFFAKRVGEIISVEHDEEWMEKVYQESKKLNLNHWHPLLIRPENNSNAADYDPSEPMHYSSHSQIYRGKTFKAYASSIEDFPDQYFDIILIDGRARPSCFMHSLRKIKPGGYIIWDNSNREHYLPSISTAPSYWKFIDFSGPTPYSFYFTKTSAWHCINGFRQ